MVCVYQRNHVGVLALARRSDKYANISVGICYENDEYELIEGTENRLHIKRSFGDRGEPLFFWAASTLKDGDSSFTVMSVPEMETFRDKFASSRDYQTKEVKGPWVDHFEAMGKKTVLMQHLKYQPKSFDGSTQQMIQ